MEDENECQAKAIVDGLCNPLIEPVVYTSQKFKNDRLLEEVLGRKVSEDTKRRYMNGTERSRNDIW